MSYSHQVCPAKANCAQHKYVARHLEPPSGSAARFWGLPLQTAALKRTPVKVCLVALKKESNIWYLYDHPAGDKEVGEGEEDPKRVCVTRGNTMQKSNYGIVLNSNHSMESKVATI